MCTRFIVALVTVLLGMMAGLACAPEEDEAAAGASSVEEAQPSEAIPDAVVIPTPPQDGRNVARRLEDATIAAKVRIALVEEQRLRPFDFEPDVLDGRVTLQGAVQTAEQWALAAEVAQRVEGVREVINVVDAPDAPPPQATVTVEAPTIVSDEGAVAEETEESPQAAAPEEQATAAASEPPAEAAPQERAPAETYHTVRSGESLWLISREYGVTIDAIKRLNNMRSNTVRPGQRLRVK